MWLLIRSRETLPSSDAGTYRPMYVLKAEDVDTKYTSLSGDGANQGPVLANRNLNLVIG